MIKGINSIRGGKNKQEVIGTNRKLEIDRLKLKLLVIILNQNGLSVAV